MIVGGLATDYCVKATAIDGVKFANTIEPEEGRLEVYALVDAMRPVSYASGTVALSLMNNGGVSLITSDELVAGNAIGLNR
jgi:nicotinamidase-related amidase